MPESNTKNVINKIIDRRKELGYSYQDLANKTGLNKSTLMRYENGDIKTLNLDSIEVIAKGLNVTPAYLMGWEDEPKEIQPHNITDVKEAMKVILAQPGLMLNGEALTDESKIALANAINMGLAYAEQMQKKEKEKKQK